jgi:hypothetical protein
MINDITIRGKAVGLPKIMRDLNFVEDNCFYDRRFVRVYVEDNELYIGHNFNGPIHKDSALNKRKKIDYFSLFDWIKYFDRI